MKKRYIKIMNATPSTGRLGLPNGGDKEVNPSDTVIWQSRTSAIKKFEIRKKKGSGNIFSSGPEPVGNEWRGQVSANAPIGAEYRYSIYWTPKGSSITRVHDPKISVRPPTGFGIFQLIILLLTTLLAIFTFNLLSKRKN